MNFQNCTLFAVGAVLLCQAVPAQQNRQSAAKALEQRFDAAAIKPGEPFPSLDVYDENGEKFNTSSLKGKYTVVVNGCLT